MDGILNNNQNLINEPTSYLVGLEISEARKFLGYWWVLENQNVRSSGSQYTFSRAGVGKITLYTNEKNIVIQPSNNIRKGYHRDEGGLFMGFFEDELQKMFGKNSPISDAQFGGRACVGRLGETTNVKLQFVTLGTHERYEGLKATVFNRNDGEIDSNTFRFADILGKNVTKHNLNNNMPYVWAESNNSYEWYAYKPTVADYTAVAKEVNAYLEMFKEQQRQPVEEKAKTLYLLYWQGEWGAESNAKLELITSDKKTLYAAIGSEILSGNMVYLSESGGEGFEAYKKDYLAGVDVLKELNWGFVKEMNETLLSDAKTISEYQKAANDYLAADFRFDPAEYDRAYNSDDEEEKMTVFCDCCIRAVKSRGEKIFVGDIVRDEEYDTCGWCGEPNEELYEVKFDLSLTNIKNPCNEEPDEENDYEI